MWQILDEYGVNSSRMVTSSHGVVKEQQSKHKSPRKKTSEGMRMMSQMFETAPVALSQKQAVAMPSCLAVLKHLLCCVSLSKRVAPTGIRFMPNMVANPY